MKRQNATTSTSLKKVRFSEDTKNDSSISPSKLAAHHYHLGDLNYAVVSSFAGSVRVHLRQYHRKENGDLIPTKCGVTLNPILWSSLIKKLELCSSSFQRKEIVVIQDALLLSKVSIENTSYISLQRYFTMKDFSRKFIPRVSLLSENEFDKLKDIQEDITSSVISLMFEEIFPSLVLGEIAKCTLSPTTVENVDAEIVLTTSLIELLKTHLEKSINNVFTCEGCAIGYENQLGHECVIYNHDMIISTFGDQAILNLDLENLAKDFVQTNIHIVNYINQSFLSALNMSSLLKNAKDVYISCDPMPLRLF